MILHSKLNSTRCDHACAQYIRVAKHVHIYITYATYTNTYIYIYTCIYLCVYISWQSCAGHCECPIGHEQHSDIHHYDSYCAALTLGFAYIVLCSHWASLTLRMCSRLAPLTFSCAYIWFRLPCAALTVLTLGFAYISLC